MHSVCVAACDANCKKATGCSTKGAEKCDSKCNAGYVLGTDNVCAGQLSSYNEFILIPRVKCFGIKFLFAYIPSAY